MKNGGGFLKNRTTMHCLVFRLHKNDQVHEVQAVAIDDPGRLSVYLYTRLRYANTAERIEVLFGVKTPGAEGTLY